MRVNKELMGRVENNSIEIENIVLNIVNKYTNTLDDYVTNIKNVLEADSDSITMDDLNKILIRLCSYAYFISSKQELMGIRQDIADAVKAEKYNETYMNVSVGTIAKKTAEATEAVKEEATIALIYNRAYKILKNKYDSVNRLIDSVKKIVSSRMALAQLGLKE